uniref:Uncharacterized protein n=1 Tax=Anguilla anguilla TaxID=7936 RepID=A0A0E9WAX4_ANGAN
MHDIKVHRNENHVSLLITSMASYHAIVYKSFIQVYKSGLTNWMMIYVTDLHLLNKKEYIYILMTVSFHSAGKCLTKMSLIFLWPACFVLQKYDTFTIRRQCS